MTILAAVAGNPVMALAAKDPITSRWTPGIGDPTIYGWITVLAYLAAAILLFANLRLAKRLGFDMYFWLVAGLLMFFLCINKQLDLQAWFTQMGRDLARSHGWYDNRRAVQQDFITFLVVAGVGAVGIMCCWIGKAWKEYLLCGIGLVAIVVFIIVRAASFHHVDQLLRVRFADLRVNVMLELFGIALVVTGAASWRNKKKAIRTYGERGKGKVERLKAQDSRERQGCGMV